MSNKIPTAEEFLEEEQELIEDIIDGGQSYSMGLSHISTQMIEFAKLHVKAALTKAAKKAKIEYWRNTETGSHEEIDKDSILNAYPDKLII